MFHESAEAKVRMIPAVILRQVAANCRQKHRRSQVVCVVELVLE
jgi:hypothetical protein